MNNSTEVVFVRSPNHMIGIGDRGVIMALSADGRSATVRVANVDWNVSCDDIRRTQTERGDFR